MEKIVQAPKPTYDVGYWEYVYERELKGYLAIIKRKAIYIQKLEEKDLFELPEAVAKKINKQIKVLSDELTILYGMKLFMDEMKNCYLDSSERIYDAYHFENLKLQEENFKLRKALMQSEESEFLYLRIAVETSSKVQALKNQLQ